MEERKKSNIGRLRYLPVFLAGLAMVLFFQAGRVEAAESLALFNFENASNMKVEKGKKLNLAEGVKASSWKSSNPKVVKVSKKGVATALKAGKAVITAKVNGKQEECQVTVVKNILKGSSYIKKISGTWENPDNGKKVTVKQGKLADGITEFLVHLEQQNPDDVVYKNCSKITAIEEDSSGASVYFKAVGVLGGKETSFPCVAVFTDDYEYEQYDYSLMLQPVVWVTDDGQLLYGAGSFWYA